MWSIHNQSDSISWYLKKFDPEVYMYFIYRLGAFRNAVLSLVELR